MAKNGAHSVEGYYYEDEDLLEEARKEAEGVRYMKAKIDLQNPECVLQIYNRMIEQRAFQTQVGYSYLHELQDYLYTMPNIPNDQILSIPVWGTIRVTDASFTTEKLREENKSSRHALHVSIIGNVLAVLVIAAMFVIVLSSDRPTVLNYEKKLLDKYAVWEQELEERENAIREKERVLMYGDDN